jgi:DNA helicase-2/ATP-dependent DNA helicase PcrA
MINDFVAPSHMLLDKLNPVQREAVVSDGGPLLILAGAGSGKTRVLTRRIAWLIREQAVSPQRVLAVTFTNKAAREMRGRVETLLGCSVRNLWIGTFHSLCLRWLRRHAREAGYQPNMSVFDEDDSRALLRRLLKQEGFDGKPRRAREMKSLISRAKNRGLTPEQLQEQARTPAANLIARIYTSYQQALRRQNAADFDDLLLGAHRLFATRSEIADAYADQFLHVLVDEYQDTNGVQFLLVERLARRHRNIFVVGDDDQSIYGWRGADIRNILDFKRHFPKATIHYMEQNYRSTQPILEFANAIVRHNEGRWEKTLWTEREGGEPPEFFLAPDEDEEAEEIARRVTGAVSAGRHHREMAVFYRTHAQSRALEDAFLRRGVPYVLVGGVYFYQRREVKDLMSYLRVLVNPLDEIALRRALGVPRRGVGERTREVLLAAARARAASPLEVAAAGLEGVRPSVREKLKTFGEMMLGLERRLQEPPETILAEIVQNVGYREHLRQEGGEWEERAANVDELIEGARLFSSAHEGGVADYLDQVSLLTNVDNMAEGSDAITLMTAHNAKGLEFPLVFVTGLEEGIFPHVSAFDDQEEMEEERRLFYVACTRAMDRLILSASMLRRRFTGGASGVSRFLGEVSTDLYTETGSGGDGGGWPLVVGAGVRGAGGPPRGGRHESGGRLAASGQAAGADALDHPLVGRRVFHATFGPGIVTRAEGEDARARITVRFHSGRTRKVISGYLEWED